MHDAAMATLLRSHWGGLHGCGLCADVMGYLPRVVDDLGIVQRFFKSKEIFPDNGKVQHASA